jgi:hypothetical protein
MEKGDEDQRGDHQRMTSKNRKEKEPQQMRSNGGSHPTQMTKKDI